MLTRPDLVFLRTVGVSTTAGAGAAGAVAFFSALGLAAGLDALLVAVLALGLTAVFALVAVLGLVALALVAAFLGAAFFAVLGLVSAFSFCGKVSRSTGDGSEVDEPLA